MESVGAYEAKTHLPKLLERVMKGESIVITKHGVPVAVLRPPKAESTVDVAQIISDIRRFREKRTLGNVLLKDLIEEGRR